MIASNCRMSYINNSVWTCPACSFDNPSTNSSICEICQQTDTQSTDDSCISDSSNLTWECAWCEWRNDEDNVFCESCCQEKPAFVNIYY